MGLHGRKSISDQSSVSLPFQCTVGTVRLCPHQGQHQEVRVKVRSVGSCSGEDKTNKNTASGHGTTVLTSDWLGGDQQPAAATELRGRGQRMELQLAARDKLL